MNILIIRDDRLGDLILTLPIINKLKENFPNSRITLVISGVSRDLVSHFKFIDDFIVFDNSLNTLKKINSRKIDLLLNFSPLKKRPYKFFLKAKKKINIIYTSRYKIDVSQSNLKIKFFNLFFHKNYLNLRNNLNKLNHQTIYMNKILNNENIYSSNTPKKINLVLKNNIKYEYLIHLSNRWIKDNYNNFDLMSLIDNIFKKSYKIIFSTDISIDKEIKDIIKKIKNKYSLDVFISPNFHQWINLIDKSRIIISPECGCSHICGILNKKAIIIYDSKNKPSFIKKEYQPYLAKKILQINSDAGEKLNKKILSLV